MNRPEEKIKSPKERYEIILAGSGGQGLILSALLLGEGAIREGRNVVQTQSYGIAARGGISIAELIIDSEEIIFQQVQKPDVILALTEAAVEEFAHFADRGTYIFYDTTCITRRRGRNFCGLPFTEAANSLGHKNAANLIALGAVIARTGIILMESLVSAVTATLPKAAAGIEALRLGEKLMREMNAERSHGE